MDDCLDSYIVGACMHLLGLPEINAEPLRKQPLFDILPEEERYKFISKIAKDILEKYIKITDGNSTKICFWIAIFSGHSNLFYESHS